MNQRVPARRSPYCSKPLWGKDALKLRRKKGEKMEKMGRKVFVFFLESHKHVKFSGICSNLSAKHFLNNQQEDTVYFLL